MQQNTSQLHHAICENPRSYLGNSECGSVNIVIHELIANSIYQFLINKADTITLKVSGNTIYYGDNGPGLPFGQLTQEGNCSLVEYIFTHQRSSFSEDKTPLHLHLLGARLGLAFVNATSKKITVESKNKKICWRQTFGQGGIHNEARSSTNNSPSGTQYELILDPSIFSSNAFDRSLMRKTLFEVTHLFPGLIIEFEQERFQSERGLQDYIQILNRSSKVNPLSSFYFQGEHRNIQLQVATMGTTDTRPEYICWKNGLEIKNDNTYDDVFEKAFKEVNFNPQQVLFHLVIQQKQNTLEFALPTEKEIEGVIQNLLESPLWVFMTDKK